MQSRGRLRWWRRGGPLLAGGLAVLVPLGAGAAAGVAGGAAGAQPDLAHDAAASAAAADLRWHAGAPAAAREVPTFPPQGARWNKDGSGLVGTYYLTTPRMGLEPGSAANYAIHVWQELLTEAGFPTLVDGIFHPQTDAAVRAFQAQKRIRVTGRINYPTGRALLTRTIRREAARVGMSPDLLCGHLGAESRLDAGAVGPDGTDLGLGQISMYWFHPDISVTEAFDEDFSVRYMAERDVRAFERYGDWRIAVVDYNNPARARAWAETGVPDEKALRYSERVFEGCTGPQFPGDP